MAASNDGSVSGFSSGSAKQLDLAAASQPLLGCTENGGLTYVNTGAAILDFFFDVMQGTPDSTIFHHLEAAWREDRLSTLKLVFNLRAVRHGKAAKKEFFTCADWLHLYHPLTLRANLKQIPRHGCWKDLATILHRIAYDEHPSTPKQAKSFVKGQQIYSKAVMMGVQDPPAIAFSPSEVILKDAPDSTTSSSVVAVAVLKDEVQAFAQARAFSKIKKGVWKQYLRRVPLHLQPLAKAHFYESVQMFATQRMDEAAAARREKRKERADTIAVRRNADPAFNSLYEGVVDLFVEELQKDLKLLQARKGRLPKGSLAAKWAPSPGGCHDRCLGLAKAIARKLYTQMHPPQDGSEHTPTEQRMLDYYRHQFLKPLRTAISSPERFMSARKWDLLPYNRVPSVAMTRYMKLFHKHDAQRFENFLGQVKLGKRKIASGALLPHEMVEKVLNCFDPLEEKVLELQWQSYVESLRQSGGMGNALAICDVSGSMSGTPLTAALALSLLLAELSSPPFNKLVCTFSSTPILHRVDQSTLRDKLLGMKDMDMYWEQSTNIQAAFDLVLKMAVESHLPADGMIKTLFIFSDMEFDAAVGNGYQSDMTELPKTDFHLAVQKFAEAGYQLPAVVFWNLRGVVRSKPVTGEQEGVAMLSGFSGKMMKMFLEGSMDNLVNSMGVDQVASPIDHLRKLLQSDKYKDLVVID